MHRYTLCRLFAAEGPKPPVIGAAASDAQAAVGGCWYIPAEKDTPGGAAQEGRTAAVR